MFIFYAFIADVISPVAIDDISITPGHCPPVITCDFDLDMCGWTQESYHNLWDLGIGRVEKPSALPRSIAYAPHPREGRIGMFMYTDFTSLRQGANDAMNMRSEYVPATSASCLTFYYLPLSFKDPSNKLNVILINGSGESIIISIHLYRFFNRKTFMFLPRICYSNHVQFGKCCQL